MTQSNETPQRIEQLGRSLYAYNYAVEQTDEGYKYQTLVFDHIPCRNEVINRIILEKYPDGEESAIQRKGIIDSRNEEFVAYNEFVEQVKLLITQEFENEAI